MSSITRYLQSFLHNFGDIFSDPPEFEKHFICPEIGYGIFTTKSFKKDSILLEYKGKLLGEQIDPYSVDNKSYIFYFNHNKKTMCIDATATDYHMARYVNDSPEKFANTVVIKRNIKGEPRLFLKAKKNIPAFTELRYNYGDSKSNLFWRKEECHLLEPFTMEELRRYRLCTDVTRKIQKIRPVKVSQVLKLFSDGENKKSKEDGMMPSSEVASGEVGSCSKREQLNQDGGNFLQVNEPNPIETCSDENLSNQDSENFLQVNEPEPIETCSDENPSNQDSDNFLQVNEPKPIETCSDENLSNQDSDNFLQVNEPKPIETCSDENPSNQDSDKFLQVNEPKPIETCSDENPSNHDGGNFLQVNEPKPIETCSDENPSNQDGGNFLQVNEPKPIETCSDENPSNQDSHNFFHVNEPKPIESCSDENTLKEDSSKTEECISLDTFTIVKVPDEDCAAFPSLEGILTVDIRSSTNESNNVCDDNFQVIKAPPIDNCSNDKTSNNDADIDVSNKTAVKAKKKNSKKSNNKEKKKCPLCGDMVIEIPKHLRTKKHAFDEQTSRTAVSRWNIRKPYTRQKPIQRKCSTKKRKPSVKKECPICDGVTTQPGEHLEGPHKMTERNAFYYECLSKFTNYQGPPELTHNSNNKILINTSAAVQEDNIQFSTDELSALSLLSKNKRFNIHVSLATSNADTQLSQQSVCNLSKSRNEDVSTPIEPCSRTPSAGEESISTIPISVPSEHSIDIPKTERLHQENESANSLPIKTYPTRKRIEIWPLTRTAGEDEELTCSSDDDSDDETYVPPSESQNSDGDESERFELNEELQFYFAEFLKYLKSPDARLEKADEMVADVKRIAIAVKARKLNDLLDADNLREQYLENHCNNRLLKANSIKKYLGNLCEFYHFLQLRRRSLNIAIDCEIVIEMIANIKRWKKNFRRAANLQTWERKMAENEILVKKEHVIKYFKSSHYKSVCSLFEKVKLNKNYFVRFREYCEMRDHLLLMIELANAHRSGVSANFVLYEYGNVRFENNFFVYEVRKHKTAYKYGPAEVALDDEEKEFLDLFVNKVRAQRQSTRPNIFLAWTGNPMLSGAISAQLCSLWIKLGFSKKGDKRMSCNIFRKSACTNLREVKDARLPETADLMGHNIQTADLHYNIRSKQKSATIGSQALRELYGMDNRPDAEGVSSPLKKKKKKQWNEDEETVLQDILNKSADFSVDTIRENADRLETMEANDKQVYDKLRYLNDKSPIKKPRPKKRSRKGIFSPNELHIIKMKCQHLIREGMVTEERIRSTLESTDMLCKFEWEKIRTRLYIERKLVRDES